MTAKVVFQTGEIIDLDLSQTITLGKEEECDVHLPYRGISRFHARIVQSKDGQFCIRDLGSSNGTMLNGIKLSPQNYYVLEDGDVISFGGLLQASVELDLHEQTIHNFLQSNEAPSQNLNLEQIKDNEYLVQEEESTRGNFLSIKMRISDFLAKFTQQRNN